MTALCAAGDCARCGERFFDYFWLIPGLNTGNQKGISPSADGDSGGAHVLGPWPNKSATALRENAPPGPFLVPQGSRKACEKALMIGAVVISFL